MQIQPVVLSGGSGTRLWPLSREKYPKQLLPLIGEDSLLAGHGAPHRRHCRLRAGPPMVVCNEEYRFVIAEQLRLMERPGTMVLEPTGRNTAPALTLAALAAGRDGADPVLLVMPADHVITNTEPSSTVCARVPNWPAVVRWSPLASHPTHPETGYGYIQAGEPTGPGPPLVTTAHRPFCRKAGSGHRAVLPGAGHLPVEQRHLHDASIRVAGRHGGLSARHSGACTAAWDQGARDGEFVRVARSCSRPAPATRSTMR
jgi:mannose-1-phosphate guanylyltransferase/mannose-6-phosphate isomerase